MRKVIQISTTDVDDEYQQYVVLYALCDDGVIFEYSNGARGERWSALKPIPQGNIDDLGGEICNEKHHEQAN